MGFFDFGVGTIAGLIQGKPDMPDFDRINPQEEQQAAISGNLAAMPQAQQLASGVNAFNQSQIDQMLQRSIPLYDQLRGQASGVVSQMLQNDSDWASGKISKELSDRVQNDAAVKALGGGFAGSNAHGNLVARDLGLTGLQLQQMAGKGLSSAESWLRSMNSLYSPGQFNVASMFLTPGQQIATQMSERDSQFQHDWASNLNDWQHSWNYLLGNEMQQASGQFNSMVGSIVGKAGGMAFGGMI